MPVRRGVPTAALAFLLAAISVGLTGCGSSGAPRTALDPARVVPASVPLYAGAYVRPSGSLRSAALLAGRNLTARADPYLRLLDALQTPGSGALDFKREIEPWLGSRAGVFLTATGSAEERAVDRLLTLIEQGLLGGGSTGPIFPFAAHAVEGAILLDTSDTAKAHAFLIRLASRARAHTSSYRGVSYLRNANGIAFALIERIVVVGTESGVRAVIDTAAGGPSLASDADYAKLQAVAPAGTLASVYANAGAFGGGRRSGNQATMSAFSALAGRGLVNLSLVPSGSSIAIDADALQTASTSSGSAGLFSSSAQAAQSVRELPGESWLAIGLGNVGKTLGADIDAIEGVVSLAGSLTGGESEDEASAISVKGLLEGILKPLRALSTGDARTTRQLESWIGPIAVFASGTGLLELKGGIVIDSTDRARSRAAVSELSSLLRSGGASVQRTQLPGTEAAIAARISGLPVVLDIAAGNDASGDPRFVIGLGEQSVATALDPSNTVASSAAYGAASSALGQGIQPSVLVDFPTLLGLLEGIGLSEDASIKNFVPYLRSLSTLSGGGRTLGNGIERFRLVLGLHGAGG